MKKDKLKPNTEKIKKIQSELELTVRSMGQILKNLNNPMSERTYSNIVAGTLTTEKQMEKIMNAFKQRAKELKKEFKYELSNFFIKSFKSVEFKHYLEELSTGDSFNSQLSQHFIWFETWKRETKIFKYFVSLTPETTPLITAFLESIDEVAKLSKESVNHSDIATSWTATKDQVGNEIYYLRKRAELEAAAKNLKNHGVRIFFGNLKNFEVRPDWKLLEEEKKLLPVAHSINYFIIAFCSEKTAAIEVKNKQNYSLDDLEHIVSDRVSKFFKGGLKIREDRIDDFVFLRKYMDYYLKLKTGRQVHYEKADLKVEFLEKDLDQVKNEFSQYIKFECNQLTNLSKKEKSEVEKYKNEWLKRINEAQKIDCLWDYQEFDHYLFEMTNPDIFTSG